MLDKTTIIYKIGDMIKKCLFKSEKKNTLELAESCKWKCYGRTNEICNHCTQYKSPSK